MEKQNNMNTNKAEEIREDIIERTAKNIPTQVHEDYVRTQIRIALNNYAVPFEKEIDSLTKEVERLRNINISVKEILADTKTMIHQEFLMDDDFDGVWRDTNEIILSKINNIIPQI